MTELRIEPYPLPAAELGPENPLPAFSDRQMNHEVKCDDSLPEQARRYLGWQTGFRVLPHRMQDGYTRQRRERAFRAVVLENDHLRAVFLPEVGGKLWSLVDKGSGRELLARNPVFQPANLALRNAWTSGGIEWNTSHVGHHCLTCSPVFATRVEGLDGEPVLRLYEWDRVQCYPWQIDFHLPADSRFLFAHMRIVNPHDHELAMYWWTNIAVPEQPGARTLGPAEQGIYPRAGGWGLIDLPVTEGRDFTYATNHQAAGDFFMYLPEGQRPWVAHLDAEGAGLVQTSTARLRGRKMFWWGMSQGGRRWQEFLSAGGSAYVEIQAGLARTQFEHVPMPAGAQWSWVEAFGLLEADPQVVHGADWSAAWREAERRLDEAVPAALLDHLDNELAAVQCRPPREVLAAGSGWGALERRRLARSGREATLPAELPFDDTTLGPDQQPWLELLEKGRLPERAVTEQPGHLMVQPEWRALLEASVTEPAGGHWLAWLHLGVMRLEAGEEEPARAAWQRSLEIEPSAWALRNLAVLEQRAGNHQAACDLLGRAWQLGPPAAALAIEYAAALLKLERYDEVRALVANPPPPLRDNERLILLAATAAVRSGQLDEVAPIFERDFATVREGEVALTDLWFAWHEQRLARAEGVPVDDSLRARVRQEFPPPPHIDFRMSG